MWHVGLGGRCQANMSLCHTMAASMPLSCPSKLVWVHLSSTFQPAQAARAPKGEELFAGKFPGDHSLQLWVAQSSTGRSISFRQGVGCLLEDCRPLTNNCDRKIDVFQPMTCQQYFQKNQKSCLRTTTYHLKQILLTKCNNDLGLRKKGSEEKLGQRLQAMASSNGGKQSPKLVLFLFLCFVVFTLSMIHFYGDTCQIMQPRWTCLDTILVRRLSRWWIETFFMFTRIRGTMIKI